MGRRQIDSELGRCTFLIILAMGLISCSMVYLCLSLAFRPSTSFSVENGDLDREFRGGCCRGIDYLELWGDAVKWGSNFKVNSSEECCRACKDNMCEVQGGRPCLCDSWVYCGDREGCGPRFGEGIVGLETDYGTLHVKLFPDCAPHSVSYILELVALRHCVGCEFYRAESRGSSWDSEGNHIENAPFGPPYALIQGTLEAYGTIFKKIPREDCPTIMRGSVAWVGSGPEFFIGLANHHEWKKPHTVFGSLLPQDIEIAEKIANLPTIPDQWSEINVSVLKKPVPLRFRRIKTS